MAYSVIDLFSGVGGFSYGFEKEGYQVLKGYDNDPNVKMSFTKNHDSSFELMDISTNIDRSVKPDIIIGSPPCQGFSNARGNRDEKTEDDINRNNLYKSFVYWVQFHKPLIFLFENVQGFISHKNKYNIELIESLSNLGYNVNSTVINSADFGVPQNRKRFFCIGFNKDKFDDISFFREFERKNKLKKRISITETFKDLPSKVNTQKDKNDILGCNDDNLESINAVHNHFAKEISEKDKYITEFIPEGMVFRSDRINGKNISYWNLATMYEKKYNKKLIDDKEKEVLKLVAQLRTRSDVKTRKGKHQEGFVPITFLPFQTNTINGLVRKDLLKFDKEKKAVDLTSKAGHRGKYYKLSRTEISPTITTQSFNPRELLHPSENRGISLREGARIQSFPDEFIFQGSFSSIARQIGNAVPPLLSSLMAKELITYIN